VSAEQHQTLEFEGDLQPFLANHLNYHARRGVVFRKDYQVLPLLSEADFASASG